MIAPSTAARAGDLTAENAQVADADRQAWQMEQEEWLAKQARLEQETAQLRQQLQAQLEEVSSEKQALLEELTSLEAQKQSLADERAVLEREMDSLRTDLARREADLNRREQQVAADAQELNRLQQLFASEQAQREQTKDTPQVSSHSEEAPTRAASIPDTAAHRGDKEEGDDIFARLRAMSLLKGDADSISVREESRSPADKLESWRTGLPLAAAGEVDSAQSQLASVEDAAKPAAEADPAQHHEDESINDYMASLLARVRGIDATPPVPRAPVERPSEPKTKEPTPRSDPAPARVVPPKPVEAPPALATLEPRTTAPEKSANLAAMRQLANFTARSAIAAHHNRHGLNRIWRTLGIGAATLVAGLVLLCFISDLQSWYVLGAVVTIGASAAWFFRAFHLSQKLKLRRRKAEHEQLAAMGDASAPAPQQSEQA